MVHLVATPQMLTLETELTPGLRAKDTTDYSIRV